jgi:hypothetical protein
MNEARMDTVSALQTALAAEHAAIYGYGVAGSRLRDDTRESARTLWDAHRDRRDRLTALIAARRARPVAAAAAYRLPVRVTSERTARLLVAALEDRLAAAYLVMVGADDARLRAIGAQWMQEAVTRAVRWRGTPPGSAFPGMSKSALYPKASE